MIPPEGASWSLTSWYVCYAFLRRQCGADGVYGYVLYVILFESPSTMVVILSDQPEVVS
jgi:hypothetical protein